MSFSLEGLQQEHEFRGQIGPVERELRNRSQVKEVVALYIFSFSRLHSGKRFYHLKDLQKDRNTCLDEFCLKDFRRQVYQDMLAPAYVSNKSGLSRSSSKPNSPTCSFIKKHKPEVPRAIRVSLANHQPVRGTSRRCSVYSTKDMPVLTVWSCKICKPTNCPHTTDGIIEVSGQQLSVVFDPSHPLKGLRNNLLTKDLLFKGKVATWKNIQTVFDADCQLGHKMSCFNPIEGKNNQK
ncbi:unnamed protein product [Colias eurytheme]|nr:unnamed protein product [Colias eurytheme]